MGYRVGYQCFTTSEAAHDYLLSQQPPTITQYGRLIRPVKVGKNWYFGTQRIQLSFPQCSIAEQIAEGALLSGLLIFLAVIVFGINQIRRLIESVSKVGIDDD